MQIKLRDNVTQKDFKSATFEERDVDKVSVDILKKCKITAGITTDRIKNIWLVKIEGAFAGRTLF